MDESERESVRLQAKSILNNFSKALDEIKVKKIVSQENVGGFREEGSGDNVDVGFREIIFENAPDKEGDFIIAEKKTW